MNAKIIELLDIINYGSSIAELQAMGLVSVQQKIDFIAKRLKCDKQLVVAVANAEGYKYG